MHKTGFQRVLRRGIRAFVNARLEVRYDVVPAESLATMITLLRLLLDPGSDLRDADTPSAREQAIVNLARMLPLAFKNQMVHFCGFGCCVDRAQSVDRIAELIIAVFLGVLPAVPALNRWLKLYQPLAWWTLAVVFGAVLSSAIVNLVTSFIERECPLGTADAVGDDAEAAVSGSAHQAERRRRLKKTVTFLTSAFLVERLLVCCVMLRIMVRLMGTAFNMSKSGGDKSVPTWAHVDTSPACRALRSFLRAGHDTRDALWFPVVAVVGWTEYTQRLVFVLL
jgi:hypothetical protein